jgi:hypothetical protein
MKPAFDVTMTNWDSYPWLAVLPPNRPDEENLAQLRSLCQVIPERRCACVLGSTPEYRTVLGKLFETVVVIDKFPAFKAKVDWMCPSTDREAFAPGDWAEVLPNYRGAFNLVVGHFTHGNIPYARRADFLSAIERSLIAGGVFFDTVFNPPRDLLSRSFISDRYADKPVNLRTINDLNSDFIFRGEYIDDVGYVDTDAALDWLGVEGQPDTLQILVAAMLKLVTPPHSRWDYHPDRPPEVFGYDHTFTVRSRRKPTEPSVFADSVITYVSTKANDEEPFS